MSIPLNHHFVSQVHTKNFFNSEKGKIYVYDKAKKNLYSKKTTKSLFSERLLNSRYKEGEIDHTSIENDLNEYFEKDFRKNTEIVQAFIIHTDLTNEVGEALLYFAKYGIIGDMRTPRHKKYFDDAMIEALSKISENATPQLKGQIEEMFEFTKKVKYSNTIEYSKIAEKILDLMGNLIFQILIPKNEEDFFIIPDFAAATFRAKINDYFNPDVEEIAYIGIPLTSKIYIHFHSEKYFKNEETPSSRIKYCSTEEVNIHNNANLDYSQNKIACENEVYLKKFIESL